ADTAGVDWHAARRRVRPQFLDWQIELRAAVAPPELRVGNVAAAAIRKAEVVFAGMKQPVQLVVRLILGEPVALILGEVQHLLRSLRVHADDMTDALFHDFHAASLSSDAA